MKPLSVYLFLGAVIAAALAYPNYRDNQVDNEELLDLSVLGDKVFGLPKNTSGAKVLAWDPSSDLNPEELGEYAQGDILFPPDSKRNGLRAEATRWPQGIVPYEISGSFSQADHLKIKQAIAEYHKHTCIRFVEYNRNKHKDYITITNKMTGCWSSVGRIGGRQEVNIQSPGCLYKYGTIVHELLHALGFLHEQSRWDRDNFVRVNFNNIKPGEEYNFNKASKDSTEDFGVVYDYDSVMHYSKTAFSVNGRETIIPTRGNGNIGQRDGLSQGDIRKIKAMYCNGKPLLFPWLSALQSIFGF